MPGIDHPGLSKSEGITSLEKTTLTAWKHVASLPVGSISNVGLDDSAPLELSADPRVDTLLLPPVLLQGSSQPSQVCLHAVWRSTPPFFLNSLLPYLPQRCYHIVKNL
jgi:hypothetical protein